MLQEVQAVGLVQTNDDLGIGVRRPDISCLFRQLVLDVLKVVELAVDDGVDCAVGTVKGLISAGCEVVDGETGVTQDCSDQRDSLDAGASQMTAPILASWLVQMPSESGPRCLIRSRLALICLCKASFAS